jgi:hypothetical protein
VSGLPRIPFLNWSAVPDWIGEEVASGGLSVLQGRVMWTLYRLAPLGRWVVTVDKERLAREVGPDVKPDTVYKALKVLRERGCVGYSTVPGRKQHGYQVKLLHQRPDERPHPRERTPEPEPTPEPMLGPSELPDEVPSEERPGSGDPQERVGERETPPPPAGRSEQDSEVESEDGPSREGAHPRSGEAANPLWERDFRLGATGGVRGPENLESQNPLYEEVREQERLSVDKWGRPLRTTSERVGEARREKLAAANRLLGEQGHAATTTAELREHATTLDAIGSADFVELIVGARAHVEAAG